MLNNLPIKLVTLMLLCLINPFFVYADAYKGFQWGVGVQELLDKGEIELREGKTELVFEAYSGVSHSLNEMMNIFFGVPFILNNPNQQPPKSNNLGPVLGKIMSRVSQTIYYRYYEEVLPEIKWVNGKSGDIAFFQDRYAFYSSAVEPVSFDAVLAKLKNKYGKPAVYSADSKSSQTDVLTFYTWKSGATVIILSSEYSDTYPELNKSRAGALTYMSASIAEEIKSEVQRNIAERKKAKAEAEKKTVEENLGNIE